MVLPIRGTGDGLTSEPSSSDPMVHQKSISWRRQTTNLSLEHVPTEVLMQVLYHRVTRNLRVQPDRHAVINLASVCRQWRDIIYHHPQFWTNLSFPSHITFDGREFSHDLVIPKLEAWFSRARQLPLSLELEFSLETVADSLPLRKFLLAPRNWKRLSLTVWECGNWIETFLLEAIEVLTSSVPSCWPLLEELEITEENGTIIPHATFRTFYSAIPTLKKIQFLAGVDAPDQCLLSFTRLTEFPNLTCLTIEFGEDPISIIEILFQILENCPRLISLSYASSDGRVTIPEIHSNRLVHQTLSEFSFVGYLGPIFCLLHSLCFPKLKSLALVEIYDEFASVQEWCTAPTLIINFLRASQCTLERLTFNSHFPDDFHLIPILLGHPSIAELTLIGLTVSHADSLLRRLMDSRDPEPLPHLHTFHLGLSLELDSPKDLEFPIYDAFIGDRRRWWTNNKGDQDAVTFNRLCKLTQTSLCVTVDHWSECTWGSQIKNLLYPIKARCVVDGRVTGQSSQTSTVLNAIRDGALVGWQLGSHIRCPPTSYTLGSFLQRIV